MSPLARPIVPLPTLAKESPSKLLDLVAEYQGLTARLPALDHALDTVLAEAGRLQAEFHQVEDRIGIVLDAIEDAPVTTPAEGQAKLAVAQALTGEGLDPGRHRLLAAAEADVQRFITSTYEGDFHAQEC